MQDTLYNGTVKHIALTGVTGMVGYHVREALWRRKISYTGASRSLPYMISGENKWFLWNLLDRKSHQELDDMFGKPDAFLHIGASVPGTFEKSFNKSMESTNVNATKEISEWTRMRDIPLVFLSSSVVYADPMRTNIQEDDEKIVNGAGVGGYYGLTKLLGEQAVQENRKHIILRPSSIYGNGLPKNKMISKFLKQAQEGETISLEPPDDSMNLIHARDVANAMLDAVENEVYGIYNIGGQEHSVSEIANTAVRVVGNGRVKMSEAVSREPSVRFGLNSDRAKVAFGFRTEISLDTGLRLMTNALAKESQDREEVYG